MVLADLTNIGLSVGKTYTISGTPEGHDYTSAYIYVSITYSDGTLSSKPNVFTIEKAYKSIVVYLMHSQNATENELSFKPMLEEGDTQTSYVPYHEEIKSSQISGIKSTGRNLINFDNAVADETTTPYYSNLIKNEDGSYTITRTTDGNAGKPFDCFLPKGSYQVSYEYIDSKAIDITHENQRSFTIYCKDKDGNAITSGLVRYDNYTGTPVPKGTVCSLTITLSKDCYSI